MIVQIIDETANEPFVVNTMKSVFLITETLSYDGENYFLILSRTETIYYTKEKYSLKVTDI